MIIINGTLVQSDAEYISASNRGYTYGDALFETIKVIKGKILFFEDHYFRLMASMRIMRMEIPMNFTLEFIESEITRLIEAKKMMSSSVRVKFMVNRKQGGLYAPNTNDIDYLIFAKTLNTNFYTEQTTPYTVDLFKDFYTAPGLLSTLKNNNRLINVIGSIYARENNLDNCLLLNTNKNVVETLNGNIFLVKDNNIKTPPLVDGCIKGVMRTQIIKIINSNSKFTLQEASISPFELQKADELFFTNVIIGLQSITTYRKKIFSTQVAQNLIQQLNAILNSN